MAKESKNMSNVARFVRANGEPFAVDMKNDSEVDELRGESYDKIVEGMSEALRIMQSIVDKGSSATKRDHAQFLGTLLTVAVNADESADALGVVLTLQAVAAFEAAGGKRPTGSREAQLAFAAKLFPTGGMVLDDAGIVALAKEYANGDTGEPSPASVNLN